MKKWMVEYKDRSDFGCGVEIMAPSEHLAIIRLVELLLEEDDFMSRLLFVMEAEDEIDEKEKDAKWSIKGGPMLEQEHQDTLHDAMDSVFNEDGESLREAMEKSNK